MLMHSLRLTVSAFVNDAIDVNEIERKGLAGNKVANPELEVLVLSP